MMNLPAGIGTSFMPMELVITLPASSARMALRTGHRTGRPSSGRGTPDDPGNLLAYLGGVPLHQLPGPEADDEDRRQPGDDGSWRACRAAARTGCKTSAAATSIDRAIRTGASQLVTRLAVALPANPSRARKPAVVQVGAAPASGEQGACQAAQMVFHRYVSIRT